MERQPLSIASIRVDLTGNTKDAWCGFARSLLVVSERTMALHELEAGITGSLFDM